MNNKMIVKQSVEYKYFRNTFLILVIFCIIWTGLFFGLSIYFSSFEIMFISLIFDIPLIPMSIYYGYRLIYLVKYSHNLEFKEVSFKEIHSTLFKTMYFTVELYIDENIIKKNTRAIFNSSPLSSRSIEIFNNKKVLIGFNQTDEYVITIKVLN